MKDSPYAIRDIILGIFALVSVVFFRACRIRKKRECIRAWKQGVNKNATLSTRGSLRSKVKYEILAEAPSYNSCFVWLRNLLHFSSARLSEVGRLCVGRHITESAPMLSRYHCIRVVSFSREKRREGWRHPRARALVCTLLPGQTRYRASGINGTGNTIRTTCLCPTCSMRGA